jgi:hypothetical protein
MMHYSGLLELIRKCSEEAKELEASAGRESGERNHLLTAAEVLRDCEGELSEFLWDMLDLVVEQDRQAFLALQIEQGRKPLPGANADKK